MGNISNPLDPDNRTEVTKQGFPGRRKQQARRDESTMMKSVWPFGSGECAVTVHQKNKL